MNLWHWRLWSLLFLVSFHHFVFLDTLYTHIQWALFSRHKSAYDRLCLTNGHLFPFILFFFQCFYQHTFYTQYENNPRNGEKCPFDSFDIFEISKKKNHKSLQHSLIVISVHGKWRLHFIFNASNNQKKKIIRFFIVTFLNVKNAQLKNLFLILQNKILIWQKKLLINFLQCIMMPTKILNALTTKK